MPRLTCSASDIPATAEERLDEIAEIFARGVLRLETKKSGLKRGNGLDVSTKTRLSVTRSDGPERIEVT